MRSLRRIRRQDNSEKGPYSKSENLAEIFGMSIIIVDMMLSMLRNSTRILMSDIRDKRTEIVKAQTFKTKINDQGPWC